MIRKLKNKIIWLMMALIAVLLIVSFIAIYVITAVNIADDSMLAMAHAAEKPRNGFFNTPESSGKTGNFSVITIDLDELNNKFSIAGYSESMLDLTQNDVDYINVLIKAAKNGDKDIGIIESEEYNYRYMRVKEKYFTRLVLLDKSYEEQTLSSLIIAQIIIGLLLLGVFFAIIVIFASVAVKPAEKSFIQQKQLVADASHELKTPLAVISANTDLVLSNPESTVEEQSKWLGYIKTETKRMSVLISNMLFLAKNDDGLNITADETVNISDLALETALPFESVCYEKEKHYSVDIKPNLYIKGDANALKQVMAIFLDNACKYSDEQGHIEFYLYGDGDRVDMVIRNSGEPIPSDEIGRIFERFYRVNKARSRTEGGYGLGLSIAKTILDSHGAKINVTSTQKDGTIFKIIFKKVNI